MLTAIDLNRLKVFYVAYQTRNLTKAARELNVTRSSVSQSISKLERELKTTLFVRSNRNIQPNGWADKLYAKLLSFAESLDELAQLFEQGKSEVMGQLRIGAPPEFGSNHLIEVIQKYKVQNPLVSFELSYGVPDTLCRKLVRNELDFVFIDAVNIYSKLFPIEHKLVMKEEQVLCCSEKYFQKHLTEVTNFRELVAFDFLSHVPDALDIKFWFKHHLKFVPEKLKLSLVVDEVRALKKATLEGLGLSLLPTRLIEAEIKQKRLHVVRTKISDYINHIAVAWISKRQLSRAAKSFTDEYVSQLKL
jgi:DNA-binding transcriptional LysR family regulator